MNFSSGSPTSSSSSHYVDSLGSRPSSASPSFSHNALVYKFRQDACRGFDADDDFEFCPALTEHAPSRQATVEPDPPVYHSPVSASPRQAPVFQRPAARTQRALEIIDPSTGLRVASPKPAK